MERIDHSGCDHPATTVARRKCRAEKIAAQQGQSEVVVKKGRPSEKKPKRTLPLSDLQGLAESLESASDNLAGYAEVQSVVALLVIDGVHIKATLQHHAWEVEVL